MRFSAMAVGSAGTIETGIFFPARIGVDVMPGAGAGEFKYTG